MAMNIILQLNDLDEKCIRYFAADPAEWANNFVQARIYAAKQEIYHHEVRRMTADPTITTIPADIDTIVTNAEVVFANAQPEIPAMTPPAGI